MYAEYKHSDPLTLAARRLHSINVFYVLNSFRFSLSLSFSILCPSCVVFAVQIKCSRRERRETRKNRNNILRDGISKCGICYLFRQMCVRAVRDAHFEPTTQLNVFISDASEFFVVRLAAAIFIIIIFVFLVFFLFCCYCSNCVYVV